MKCVNVLRDRVVVECNINEVEKLPEPIYTLNPQGDARYLEFHNDKATLVALRICGVEFPTQLEI